jgi:peptidyl-prolyl cis-trans isomerase SurA
MRGCRKAFRALAAAVALLGVSLALSLARAEILEEIVAKVNNSMITRTQLQERLAVYEQQLRAKYSGDELGAKTEAAADGLLRNMITETLLVQRAEVLLDLDKVRKNLLDDFKKQQKIQSDEELDQLLKEQNMTRQELLDTLMRLSIPHEIINYEVRRKISVSEKDIQAYYDEHRQDFVRPERVVFREIVLLYEEANKEEVRARAQAVRRELDAGKDFGELAAEVSEVSSKERGGLVGPYTKGELNAAIESQVFALKPGELAGPIETSRAFHIIRLETKEGEQVTPLPDAKDMITEKIRDARFKQALAVYLENLWKENYIYVYPKYGSSEWKPMDTLDASPGEGP